jgi:hypothetical protein
MTPALQGKHLLLGIAVGLAFVAPFAISQRANTALEMTTLAEQYLLSAANQERSSRGLPVLHRDAKLAYAAAEHAREMAAHAGISHQFPGEPSLTERGSGAGVAFSVIAENVGEAPSVIMIHDMWMRSEHHRDNLLDPSVDTAGISVISRNGQLYAVEDFARVVHPVSLAEQESAVASLITRQGSVAVASGAESTSNARETCGMPTGYAGPRRPRFVLRFSSDNLTRLPDQLTSELASGRFREVAVGACASTSHSGFTSYNIAVLLYP